jgi:hypothetical protein
VSKLQVENHEPKTSRERFLDEQKRFKEHTDSLKKSELNVSEDEVDEFENEIHEIDKNMGDKGFSITRQEYEAGKLEDANQLALAKMQEVSTNTKLTAEQRTKLQAIVAGRNDVENPVLRHLILQKALQERSFLNLKTTVKEINDRIMKELMQASNDLLKTQGAIENIDDQILKYVEQYPSSV